MWLNKEDVMAQTNLAMLDVPFNKTGFYFIAAHTDSGTRFYSDPITTFEQAESIYNSYIDVIKYFNGGNIQLYQIHNDDFDIIAYSRF